MSLKRALSALVLLLAVAAGCDGQHALGSVNDPVTGWCCVINSTGTKLMQSSSTKPRLSACWMMLALAIVTNLSPAISFAVATASSTLPVNVVRGKRSSASVGGGRWVTTTTGAPAG